MKTCVLGDRGVIRIEGPDARSFLQGLVSNDVERADGSRTVYAALLTPQGKYLFDFFMVGAGDALLLDCARDDIADLTKKLGLYKLRAQVTVEDASDAFDVAAIFGDGAEAVIKDGAEQHVLNDGTILFTDPRLPAAGVRALLPSGTSLSALGGEEVPQEAYTRHRVALGLPAAPADLQKEKSILLESGFDELNGVDWDKGCYMGQELTARTKYRGLVKKRLVPVSFEGNPPEPGADISAGGKVVGDIRTVLDDGAIAMLRLDAIRGGNPLESAGTPIHPRIPDWMQLPAEDGE